ncbi:hypothetical protein EDB89DRAFT_320739 [Lactarius sanguifluus]|nr:hypothetical protein EDB89DRAFT_320739 [Lactarius sanguifluus]
MASECFPVRPHFDIPSDLGSTHLRPLQTMTHFVFILLLAFCLLPLPIPARPTTRILVGHQNFSAWIDGDLIYDITFSSTLLFYAWLATGMTVAQLFGCLNQICSTFIALSQRLSNLRFSSLVEWATKLGATDAGTAVTRRRRGGASYPVATVSRGQVQSGGPGRSGSSQGGGRDTLTVAPLS